MKGEVNNLKPDVYQSSDYAGLSAKNFKGYYGYEIQDENGEWCFEASFNDELIQIPFSKLKSNDMYNCEYNLMLGISWLLMKYKLI